MAALALMGTLASCQSDDEATIARPANAVGINVSVGSLQTTRSNPASTDFDEAHLFNLGDQVCVSTEGQDPVIFECQDKDNQTWAEAVPGKFLLWTQSQMTFLAYYPATEGTSMTAFTLPADQSSEAKIALADYMTRQYMYDNEYGNDINLDLERKTARVIVRIADFTDQYFDDQKTVSNVRIYSQFSGIADGNNGTGDIKEVTPYIQGTGGAGTSYTALVVPGYGDSGARFIQLSDGEGSTLLVKGIPELEAGNSYTFNLVVGKNRIEVASVTVQDWTTGETLAGGQAVEQGVATARTLAEATAEDLGKIVGADGIIYDTKAAAEAVATGNAVAMIAYVSGSNGLAIALADESGTMNWSTANSTCEGKSAVPNAAWLLPSRNQWNAMLNANGGNEESYTGLNNALATAGGDSSKLQSGGYWSSTEGTENYYWRVRLLPAGLTNWGSDFNYEAYRVRACLAFTVEQGATARALAEATAEDIGKVVGADGKIYADVAAAQAASTTACAIIAYVGSETAESQNHGLAIAMKDAAAGGKVMWSLSFKDESLTNFENVSQAVTTAQSGRSNSTTSGFDNESNYPAFYAALHNTITVSDGISAAAPASGTSGWFLPSLYQWNKIVQGLSGQSADLSRVSNDNYKAFSLNTKIEAAGGDGLQSSSYWSSTEYGDGNAWFFIANLGIVEIDYMGNSNYVRSAFAF